MNKRTDVRHKNDTVSVHGENGKIETNYSERGKQAPEPAPAFGLLPIKRVDEVSPLEEAHRRFIEAVDTPMLVDLSSEEMTTAFRKFSQVYTKYARVHALKVGTGIEVITTLDNGSQETTNVSKESDYLVTNPGGEQYLISEKIFLARYTATEEEYLYQATGSVKVFINPTGQSIKIMTPWGAEQFGDSECLLATVYDPNNPDEIGKDRYIIGREEFLDTYGNMRIPMPASILSQGEPTAESKRDKALYDNDSWFSLGWTDHQRRRAFFRKQPEDEMLIKYGSIKATSPEMSKEIRSTLDDFEWEERLRFRQIEDDSKRKNEQILTQYRVDEANQSLARSKRH